MKLQRPLSKTEKRVLAHLKKIDSIVGENREDFNAVLFGNAGARVLMILASDKQHDVDATCGEKIRNDAVAWCSKYVGGDGGDGDFVD